MSVSYIPEKVKIRLWGKAAGRCQYAGCNAPLWLDETTKCEFNTAYIAHIVADEPGGPRGDPRLSKELKCDLGNLMLLCDPHHRLVDKEDVAGHDADRLREMKLAHEQRIELVSGINHDRQSHILLYGANVGKHAAPVSYVRAAHAMLPDWYPADSAPIGLGMVNSSFQDREGRFWELEEAQLRRMVDQHVRPRLVHGEIRHLSIFGFAPQPLLMLLGSLLSDIPAAEVYQLHREPPDWRWLPDAAFMALEVQRAGEPSGIPALVLAVSATVVDERIHQVLGDNVAIWRIVVPQPHNDVLKSRSQLQEFRHQVRVILDRIKAHHGEQAVLHVFPALPVAMAIEFGRVVMPKADLPLRVYDQNRATGGFMHALVIS